MSPGNRWVDRALSVHRTERGTKAALALTTPKVHRIDPLDASRTLCCRQELPLYPTVDRYTCNRELVTCRPSLTADRMALRWIELGRELEELKSLSVDRGTKAALTLTVALLILWAVAAWWLASR